MTYFPVFPDLANRSFVVVGGGAVAERKVRGLLDAGAAVTVVAPTVTPAIAAWAALWWSQPKGKRAIAAINIPTVAT